MSPVGTCKVLDFDYPIAEPWIIYVRTVATRRGDGDDRRAVDNARTFEHSAI